MRRSQSVLALALLLLVAACGGGTEQELVITSTPEAKVFLDGEEIGTTPLTTAVAPGAHTLGFEADGFVREDVEVDVTADAKSEVDVALVLSDPGSRESLARAAEALGLEIEPPEAEIVAHRGGGQGGITLYWPKEEVRQEGLSTYRIDVDEEYMGDGFLVFRVGNRVLYRAEFDPSHDVTLERLPGEVLDAVDTGDIVTWGIVYEERKRPVTAKFKVVRDRKAGRRLAKLEDSQFFKKQDRMMQEMLKADVLRDSGLHSEAITHYLAIARTWPTSDLPYRNLLTSARRLGLEDTYLYAEGARFATGRSRLSPRGISVGGSLGREPSRLPVALAAPKLEDIGEAPVPGAGLPADEPSAAGSGAGSVTAVAATGAVTHLTASAEGDARAARELEERARMLERASEEAAGAEEQLAHHEQAVEETRQRVHDAREAARQAMAELEQASETGDKDAYEAAQENLDEVMKHLDRVEQQAAATARDAEEARRRVLETREKAGGMSAEDAANAAEDAKIEAERLRAAARDSEARAKALAGAEEGEVAGPGPRVGELRTVGEHLQAEARRLEAQAQGIRQAAERVEEALKARRESERRAEEAEQEAQKARERVEKLIDSLEEHKGTDLQDEIVKAIDKALEELAEAEEKAGLAHRDADEARQRESETMREAGGRPHDELRKEADDLASEAEAAQEASEEVIEAAEAAEKEGK